MRKLTIISVVLVVSALLILPSFSAVADEGIPWFGLIPYFVTGGPPSGDPKAVFSSDPTSGQVPLTVDFDASSSADPDGSIETYEWDFDDGDNDTGEQVTHTYNSVGDYTPELTVTDDDGKTDSYSDLTISVTSTNESPNASFTASPTSGTAPLDVTFDASDSSDPDGSIDSYSWEFGDGSTGTGETVTHTYSDSGSYTAQLTVEDDDGATDSTTVDISVSSPSNEPPNASFSASPTSGEAPLVVSFDASDSSDPDGSIDSYSWNFDDGATGSGVNVNHTFDNSGTYNVELTVTDNDGATDSTSETISVSSSTNEPPNADFSTNPTSGEAPLEVTFDASGSSDPDGNITSYDWDFDDGSTGSGETTSHTFDSSGDYTVELTVTDDDGASDTTTSQIEVSSGPSESLDTTITSGPSGTIDYRDVTFEWTGSDDETATSDLTYSYMLEGEDDSWSNWTYDTSKSYSDLGNGDYIFKVKARDDAGNIDPTPAELSFNLQFPEAGYEKWAFLIGSQIDSSPATNSDGTIYVGSTYGEFYAINPDGTKKWVFPTAGIYSSPTIGPDGTIYLGERADRGSVGKLYAIKPDGTEKWSFAAGDFSIHSSPAIGPNGTIYAGFRDGYLYALRPNGTKKWSLKTDSYTFHFTEPSPAVGPNGTIYIGSNEEKLYAITPNGTEKWSFTTVGTIQSSPAIGSDGTIYVGTNGGKLYAISPEGIEKWSFTTEGVIYSSPAIGSDGTIYVGSDDGQLYAINSDGTEKWTFETEGEIHSSSPAIGSDGTIYVGSYDKKLYAVNPSGTEKWSFETERWVQTAPTIGSNGTIYLGARDGNLYAIYSNNSGLADTPWPMFQHDPKHTGRAE